MGVAYGLFAEDLQTMGAAHTRGKTSLWLNYPQNPSDASLRFSYWNNLIGDPAIAIWQGTPENIIVERTDHYTREMNTVTLRMLNEYGDGVEGLYCCLFNTEASEQHFIISDENGYAIFPMNLYTF